MISVCLLGASGSIGQQTIDVMLQHKEDFDLVSFSVGERTRYIAKLIRCYPHLKGICLKNPKKVAYYQKQYPYIKFYSGDEGLISLIKETNPDMVVNALVGFVGLAPSLMTLENNKILCLANKESLVVGGELINNLLKQGKGQLYPIDSEHVAISKCLSVNNKSVSKIIITASGGSFRDLKRDELKDVTPEQALKHPNWKMGQKITIDSATMVNKAFEIIEAHYLFNYPSNKIDVIINTNSYVHSLVLYQDGTYRLEMNKPDMRNPIRYALYQGMCPYETYVTDDLNTLKGTAFMPFDIQRYPIIKTAYRVIKNKGNFGAIFNAANEVAVQAFLNKEIAFLDIEKIIHVCLKKEPYIIAPTYEQIKQTDQTTRLLAEQLIKKGGY